MAGGKASPRQKMINMMYLVLTALLALNVSKDILRAFHLVEVSMQKAGKNIDDKNEELMTFFKKQSVAQPEKVGPFYAKAQKAEAIKNEFIKYITELKQKVEEGAGGRKPNEHGGKELTELVQNDNIEMHANLFMNEGKGKELKEKINKTRLDLVGLLSGKEKEAIEKLSDLRAVDPEGSEHSWEGETFEHSPAAGVVTILTKIENDCKNTYTDVLNELAASISKDDKNFDKVVAKIIPKSTFVMSGGKFEADIMLVAYDSKQSAETFVGGKAYNPVDGVTKYEEPAQGQGEKTVSGYINMKTKQGVEKVDFSTSYTVYTGAATIGADKMNMLYIGLENPISISVPGFPPDRVNATMSVGTLTKKSGSSYTANVKQRGETMISVTVKMEDGTTKNMGQMKFRVRNIPKPEAKLGTLGSGESHAKGAITANASRVNGFLGDGFAYEDVKYTVTKFVLVYAPKKGDGQAVPCAGNTLSPQAQALIGKLRSGDRLIITDVSATGPDGNRNLAPVVITVQ